MRTASRRYVLAGAIGLLWVVALGAQDAARRVAGPDEAFARLRDYIGVSPSECGRYEQSRADAGAVMASAQCVIEAATVRRQSWMLVHEKGVDSWTATGVLSGSDGLVRRFFYDSKPQKGKSAPMVVIVPCAAPKILAKTSGSYAGFDCTPEATEYGILQRPLAR